MRSPKRSPASSCRNCRCCGATCRRSTPAAIALSLATIVVIAAVKTLAAAMARHADRRCRRRRGGALLHLPVATIGSQFGGIPASLPLPSLPESAGRRCRPSCRARCRVRAARLDRVVAVGGDRGQHDGPAASLQLRARRARRGERRLEPVRRHLRHRHDRAHGHERARGCARPACGYFPLGVSAAVRAARGAARKFHSARGARRRARRRCVEHGRAACASPHCCADRAATRWCCS